LSVNGLIAILVEFFVCDWKRIESLMVLIEQ